MNEKSQQLYNYLKTNGLTDLDANTFFTKYSDPSKSKEVWSYLNQNGLTDLDANAFYDSYFKKKSPSGSGSAGSSSGRLSKTTTKPTGSSSSKGEILTGFPGSEQKKYQFKDGKWYEEAPVKVYGQAPIYTQIKTPSRIQTLNKYYKKNASLSEEQQVYSNYDEEKKDNLYRIQDGQWERQVPGGKWTKVQNESSINALNRRYGKSVSTKVVSTTTMPPKKFTDINSNLVAQTEENAIDYLTKNYSKYGFDFSQEGAFLIDRIRVKTKDGSKEQVFEFDEKNPEQAALLRTFLEQNATKPYSEPYQKAVSILNKFEGEDAMAGIKMGTGQYGYEVQSSLIRAKNLNSSAFQTEFKKLSFEEQKEIINEQILGTKLPASSLNQFYKSSAYQDYKKKKISGDKASEQKANELYDQLNYAKASKDPAKIKEAQNKINSYFTDEVIQDNVKQYDMRLNDLKLSLDAIRKDSQAYQEEVARFNELAQSGNMTKEQFEAQKALLEDKAESIQTRAQKVDMERDQIIASQKKLNVVAGKYIAAKEKEGNILGFSLNKVLSGVSMTFVEPFANLEALGRPKYEELSPEEKAYYKSLTYNGKKLTTDQIENYLDNQAILKAKKESKESIIKAVGDEGTTLEYMNSADRGWFTQAIGGVLESLPAMATGVFGKAASFTGLAAQAYSGIEEEMLSDKDFQYSSALDRALIAVPYAAAMGALENIGLTNMIKADSYAGKVLMGVALKAAEKAGGKATKETLERIATKEIENMVAKGAIKITQAGLAEFETGATQALVLDQGWKNVANWWMSKDLTEEEKKQLTNNEFFDTADGFVQTASQVFEDGLSEMVGGHVVSTVGVVAQRLMNGNISLYNQDDVKFLKSIATDTEFKKLMVANLKTQMLNGNLTKSQAQEQLNAVNKIDGIMSSMPEELSDRDRMNAFNLIVERDRLQQEIDKSDPALVTAQKERVAEINNQLDKISKDAVQKQAAGEVPVQPGAAVSGEMAKGESETGLEETTKKAKEEVDQYIAESMSEFSIGSTINPLLDKMLSAEFINDNDIDNAIESIFNEVERLESSDLYSPEIKAAMSEKLLNIADKLDNYEFRTKTETVATTKAGAASPTRRTSEAVQKIRAEKYFNGVQAEVNGQQVTLSDNNGRVEAQMPNGETIVIDTPTMEIIEDGFEFDDNGALQAVTVNDRLGNTLKLTGEQALDFAIRDRENKLGVVEQAEFETVYQQVEKQYIKENLQDTQKQTNLAQDEKGKPKAGNRLFNEPLKAVAEIANRYFQRVFGSQRPAFEGTTELDVERAKRIAAAYEAMENNPNDPEVRRAYEAMAKETIEQYQAFLDAGYVVEINNEEPYATSEEMIEDLRKNKRIKIFSTESGFGDTPITPEQRAENPLLATTEFTDVNGQPMLVNDLFRAVHDFFGHAELGNSFGPKGEENAWNVHARMYSPLARRAMTTETRGQNSFVNFSGVNERVEALREEARKLREEGKLDEAAAIVNQIYDEAKFAEQKIGLLPEEFSMIDGEVQEAVDVEANLLTEKNAKLVSVKFKRNPIVRAALNIMKALPGVKIYLHEDTDQYSSALADRTGESKQSISKENSKGSYIDGEIHIDMSKADMVTLLHEAVHHAFVALGVSENLFIDLAKGIRSLITDKARLAELDSFIESYDGDELKAEEFMAQLGGILADNREELTVSKLTQFKALINRLMKKIGLGTIFKASATTKEAADLINAITFGISTGSKITDQVVGKTGKAKFQADFSDPLSKLTFVYDKNKEEFKKLEKDGYITYDKSIYDFADKYMLLHQPDAAFSGAIYKNGELLVEGKGGVYYPIKFHKDGYFWASTSDAAENMAKSLNKILEQNGGTIYMALTSAPSDKLMSSTTMSNAILDFFSSKAFDKNFQISQAQLKKALITSANDVKQLKIVNKKTGKETVKNIGLNLGLKPSMSLDEIKSLIKSKLGPDMSSFQDRKNFSLELIKLMADEIRSNPEAVKQFGTLFSQGIQNKYFKGITKTGKISISAANMKQAISEMFKEPLLKEGPDQSGQVYAVIELNGPVKGIDSNKHESYPKAIQSASKSKVKMHILKDRETWSDVFLDFDGEVDITKERKLNVFPSNTGVSPQGLRVKGGTSARKKQLSSKQGPQIKIYGEDFTDVFNKLGIPFEYLQDIKNRNVPNFLGGKTKKITELRESLLKSIENRLDLLQKDLEKQSRKITNSDSDLEFRKSLINKITDKISSLEELKSSVQENLLSESDIEILTPVRKQQKAPKILGGKPTQVIVKDEYKALLDQIKLEARAQREQKREYKKILADISATVTSLKSKGNISVKQFDFIMKKLKGLNFDNQQKVSEFIDYVSRALANAEYIDNVQKAKRMSRSIAKKLKGKPNPFAVVAKMFTSLDAEYVENIADHIAVAQMIMDGVKSSSTRGGKLTLKQEPDLQVIAEYIDAEQQRQTERLLKNLQARYESITGKPSTNLPAETMLAELQALKPDVDNSADILDQIDLQLAAYSQLIDEDTPQVIIDAINIDAEEFGIADSIKVLDALDTYFANGVTSGIESLMGAYEGMMNAKKFKFKSSPMSVSMIKKLGQLRLGGFAGFTVILERKFRSLEKANLYQKVSGINEIIIGANKADFEASKKQSEYMKRFGKMKNFFSNENIYERGIIADLIRTNPNIDQDAEFQRLINILIDSKDMLLQSTDNVKVEMGKLYDKVFKKLGIYNANVTLESVLAKAEKSNIDAVNFAVDMFAEKYDQLSDTAMGVYNIMLGQDINYTPKTYLNIKGIGTKDSDPLSGEDSFGLGNISNSGFNRNEAGVLMPMTRPKDLKSNGKYIDLNFDNNMFRSYRLALTDSYTAKSIRQLNSFYNSKENEAIIGSEKDFDIIKAGLSDYINTIKGKNLINKNIFKGSDKFINILSTFGSVRALAGIGQFIQQFASGMSNTIVNAGEHIRPSDFSKKAFDFMNRSGQPIANVGENDILISLANLDKSIERATIGKNIAEIGLDEFAKFNGKAFKILVSNPDAAARRLAWMAYYRKYVIKNKLGPIDFNAEPNADAAAYAQSMVDRSMDTTDARIRGQIYRSQDTSTKILKSIFIPFSSFGMNQKTRMWGDLTKMVTGNFDLDSARSLASIGAEIAIYNVIRFKMAEFLLYAAMNILGFDDEEQEELVEKLKKNMMSSVWGKALVDVLSPLALVDNYVLKTANDLMALSGIGAPEKSEVDEYIDEENRIRELKNQDPLNAEQEKKKRKEFIEKNSMSFYISDEANWGVLGIQFEKMSEAYDIYKAMTTGEFVDNQDRNMYLDDEGMEKMKAVAMLKTAGSIAPIREVDQVANKSFSLLKKSNKMSEKVKDMSAEIKKKYGKLDPVLEVLAQKKNKMSSIEDEMNFIKRVLKEENKEGLTMDQKIEYAKILEYIPKPTKDMLLAIKANKTADQILKK